MKRFFALTTHAITAGLVLGACGSQGPEENSKSLGWFDSQVSSQCASAPLLKPGKSVPWIIYRTMIRDERLPIGNDQFSDYGVEISEEVTRNPDLLNGTGLKKRKTCTRAFVLQDGERKVYLEPKRVPGSHTIAAIRAEKNYLILSGLVGDTKNQQTELIQLNLSTAERQRLAMAAIPKKACNFAMAALPSPQGSFILLQTMKGLSCGTDSDRTAMSLTVLSDALATLGEPFTDAFTSSVQVNWVSETQYQVVDDQRTLSFTVPAPL